MKKFTVKEIALTGVMAALVFAASNIQIPIPLALDNTRIHLGNVCCLLAGIILGRVKGGLAAGMGSAFFDLTNPLYITSMPFTLVFKFLMGFVCGAIAHPNESAYGGMNIRKNTIGGIAGSAVYIVLYLSRHLITSQFFLQVELETTLITLGQKAAVSSVNAVIAVICAVPLGMAINKTLSLTKLSH